MYFDTVSLICKYMYLSPIVLYQDHMYIVMLCSMLETPLSLLLILYMLVCGEATPPVLLDDLCQDIIWKFGLPEFGLLRAKNVKTCTVLLT